MLPGRITGCARSFGSGCPCGINPPWRGSIVRVRLHNRRKNDVYPNNQTAVRRVAGRERDGRAPRTGPGRRGIPGDAARGKDLYQACSGCHSIEENDIGPKHRGVVGRPAGSVPDYAYSPALKASGLVWSADTLDRWLTNPQALVPGTKMYFSMADPQKRADLIAYLAQLK